MPLPKPVNASSLRDQDFDRYFTALFAPEPYRATLLLLYAFNHELARAPEVASEALLARIRLQWWREVVEGAARAHEVATPLRAALDAGALHAPDLLAMIEARETEADGDMPSLEAWRAWLLLGAGSLAVAAGRALGAPGEMLPRLRALGAGYGVAGAIGNIPALARRQRCLLPRDVLEGAELGVHEVIADPASLALAGVCARLAATGGAFLGRARPVPRGLVAASLPAVLARRDLARLDKAGPGREIRRGVGDRLAVMAAAVLGRA